VLTDRKKTNLLLDSVEWLIVAEVMNVLSPFEEATKKLQGQKYPTLAYVYPIFWNLYNLVTGPEKVQCKFPQVSQLQDAISKDLLNRMLSLIKPEHYLACYFDPRFKSLSFIKDQKIKDQVFKLGSEKVNQVNYSPPPIQKKEERKLSQLEAALEKDEVSLNDDDECKNYLICPKISIFEDPLSWWKKKFQNISQACNMCKKNIYVL